MSGSGGGQAVAELGDAGAGVQGRQRGVQDAQLAVGVDPTEHWAEVQSRQRGGQLRVVVEGRGQRRAAPTGDVMMARSPTVRARPIPQIQIRHVITVAACRITVEDLTSSRWGHWPVR